MKIYYKVFFFIPFCFFICCYAQSQAEVEEMIKNSDRLVRVDKLCNDLQKPESFQFVGKDIKGNSFTVSIIYKYKSQENFKDVRKFYLDWFNKNGWQQDDDVVFKFSKGNQVLAIEKVNFINADYSIYCAELYER